MTSVVVLHISVFVIYSYSN